MIDAALLRRKNDGLMEWMHVDQPWSVRSDHLHLGSRCHSVGAKGTASRWCKTFYMSGLFSHQKSSFL
jgi:hypothetical protein